MRLQKNYRLAQAGAVMSLMGVVFIVVFLVGLTLGAFGMWRMAWMSGCCRPTTH